MSMNDPLRTAAGLLWILLLAVSIISSPAQEYRFQIRPSTRRSMKRCKSRPGH